MMKKTVLALLIAVVMGVLLLTGCSTKEVETPVQQDTAAESTETKHANVGLFWVTATLDNTSGYTGWVLSRIGVAESLIRITDEMKYEGLIAESWENDGDKTWKFTIRDKVTFSTGKKVDAEAVKKSIQRSLDLNERAGMISQIDTMEADGQTITIITKEPYAALIGNLAEPLFAIIDVDAENADFENAPIATGPYVVEGFQPEESIEVVKSVNYWNGEVGLDAITFRHIPDSNTRTMAIQSGEVDITGSIDQSQINVFKDNDNFIVDEIPSLRTLFAYINHQSSVLSDLNIRKALSHAIDRESYALLIGGTPGTGMFSNALPFGNEKLKADGFDPEKAKEILDHAGYTDTKGDGIREMNGENIVLEIYQTGAHGSSAPGIIAAAMQAQFKEIGIGAEIRTVENLNAIYEEGKFDITFSNDNTGITADPQSFVQITYKADATRNYGKYSNPEMDQYIESLNSVFDPQERYEIAAKISQIAIDDVANFYINYIPLNIVGNSRIKNLKQQPIDYYMITPDIKME
ncbi:extracellular solute-binding protein, family 5 [Alkaliphilus metalliredigens QYMF]|uniref:Extracellular solute-binding protein, family 5 n=1 Tax=Alkaliphilus metalliredigens (strain QYMF) TaxID=293826 RepID=A6TPQ2_ALKMQ|nr:ABC transporter substrate-binding protein [Alkaliphilus metalliredigens]ABR48170.1 extracellular solute-binding protein, family 5 [Alkaliphilus metalliredigens QYMF]